MQACSPEEDYLFQDNQSEIVQSFRKEGYFEYSSRLNDILFAELNSIDNEIISPSMLETIELISKKVKEEKNTSGCYVIDWKSVKNDATDNNAITLEWNQKQGVIIRLFTKSQNIKQQLPSNSY